MEMNRGGEHDFLGGMPAFDDRIAEVMEKHFEP